MLETLFPYEHFRLGQEEFMADVDKVIKEKKHLIVHAPTGMGKTISTLGPGLAYALKKDFTIFFLTNRHSQHKIVIETLRKIKSKFNLEFMVVDIIGKKHMCSFDNVQELSSRDFYDYCKELREKDLCPFYLNSKSKEMKIERDLLYDTIRKESPVTVDRVYEISRKKFCSFEISADLARKANIIIADYFHVLSPGIRDSFMLRISKELGNSIIIFDEAHNLAKRARDLMSENLSTFVIENSIKEAQEFQNIHIAESLKELLFVFESIKSQKLEKLEEALITKQELYEKIDEFTDYYQFIGDLDFLGDLVREKKKRSFSGIISSFLKAWAIEEKGYTRIIKKIKTKRNKEITVISLKCLDPSILFRPLVENSLSVICMSGTLVPTEMYQDILGLRDSVRKEYPNPFPDKNRLNLIVSGVTTKFTSRNKEMYELISKRCISIMEKIPGNLIIFFPSYDLMYNISVYMRDLTNRQLFFEDQSNDREERFEILDDFKRTKNSVLMAVASGSYGEGVDLPGIIKGIIIVGLPLSKPDLETKELINYYDKIFGKGWDYAYIYPAIIKSLQNAGRCIRSENDKGVIVFLEERYKWNSYKKCFPSDLNLRVTNNPEYDIEQFFGSEQA